MSSEVLSGSTLAWADFLASRSRGSVASSSARGAGNTVVSRHETFEHLVVKPSRPGPGGFWLAEVERLPAAELASALAELDRLDLHLHAHGTLPEQRASQSAFRALLFGSHAVPEAGAVPAGFSVVAFIVAYNEADVIATTLRRLREQGVQAYLLDNWSTDDTLEIARDSKTLIGWERFPAAARPTFSSRDVMLRIEELQREIHADWFLLNDADEYRSSPWPGISLRDALAHVGSCGFSAVDHTTLIHSPIDSSFLPGTDYVEALPWFRFGTRPGQCLQIKTWKRQEHGVDLASSAGHDCTFQGRRVYPLNFLLRHYPIRSQDQAERKIFRERLPRWDSAEHAAGWHTHYDHLHKGESLLGDPTSLVYFDETSFYERFVAERLARVGLET